MSAPTSGRMGMDGNGPTPIHPRRCVGHTGRAPQNIAICCNLVERVGPGSARPTKNFSISCSLESTFRVDPPSRGTKAQVTALRFNRLLCGSASNCNKSQCFCLAGGKWPIPPRQTVISRHWNRRKKPPRRRRHGEQLAAPRGTRGPRWAWTQRNQ